MMHMCNPNMDMDIDIVHVVLSVHVCTNVCLEFLLYPNVHHLVGLFGSPLLLLLG